MVVGNGVWNSRGRVGRGTGGTVLVVDDDPEALALMVDVLEQAGHYLLFAPDAEKALSQLDSVVFDVVVSDIMMPGVDGLELVRRIKRRSTEVEVLVVTGFAAEGLAREAWRAGASGLLEKPFDPDRLVAVVDHAVGRARQARRRLFEPTGLTP